MSKPCRERPLKVLIVAEHASSVFGGEALIPYQYFKYFRRMNVDVHLLVHERTRAELCKAFPNDIERLHFVGDSRINIWCHKIGRFMPDRLAVFTVGAVSHFDTQLRQRRLAKALVRQHGFNVVHEPIPVSPKQPSMMFGLSVPVVIGPMNGGMDYPPNYDLAGRFERAIVSMLRRTSVFWNSILPGKRHAAVILVANKRTYDALPSNVKDKKILVLVENGVDLDRFRTDSGGTRSDNVSIIYLGRLVDWKRVDLLIDASRKLVGKVSFQVHIVGDGPERDSLEKRVQQLSLARHVQFHGWLPQAAAAELLRGSDMMVLPSMRECGGAVVLEAMASGVPVIAANWGGPADYIVEDTGVLIAPSTPDVFVEELAHAILWMADNREARIKMGQRGRQRVQLFYDWRVKAKALLEIYEDLVSAKITDVPVESSK
jgi:glycosyltransferase involved in cell wall biosynthesis